MSSTIYLFCSLPLDYHHYHANQARSIINRNCQTKWMTQDNILRTLINFRYSRSRQHWYVRCKYSLCYILCLFFCIVYIESGFGIYYIWIYICIDDFGRHSNITVVRNWRVLCILATSGSLCCPIVINVCRSKWAVILFKYCFCSQQQQQGQPRPKSCDVPGIK